MLECEKFNLRLLSGKTLGTFYFILSTFLIVHSNISESSPVKKPFLKIVYKEDASKKYESIVKKPMDQMWTRACKRLGATMKVGKGPFGFGVFRSYACFIDEKKVYGKKRKYEWVLEITDTKSQVKFELKYKNNTQSLIQFAATTEMFHYMQNKGFADLLTFRILNQLPMVTTFDLSKKKKLYKTRSLRLTSANMHQGSRYSPPKKLMLYHLDYDQSNKMWLTTIVGHAEMDEHTPTKIVKEKQKMGKISWKVEIKKGVELGNKLVWAHSYEGRGLLNSNEKMNSVIKNSFEKLEVDTGRKKASILERMAFFLRDTTASGYLGLRYGTQFLAGDSLLGKSAFIGFLMEIRGGPLNGMRFYYDTVPKVKSEVEGQEIELAWERMTIGASVGFDPGYIVDRIDFVPKFGQWTFNANLPLYVDEGVVTQRFDVNKRLSFALEVGLEFINTWSTVRLWGARDQALSLGGVETSGVSTNRYGIDTFFTLGSKISMFDIPIQLNILGFAVLESVELSASDDSVSEDQEYRIDSVSYDSGYIGTGLAVSW